MEVHHHPDLHHEKKPWKEYLLEFLMIFLAVTMGFFAESLREHIADRNREKEYMRSMVEDLRLDSAALTGLISYRHRIYGMVDSVVVLLSSPDIKKKGDDLYYYARGISIPQNSFNNDRTIQQLKSSGSLRLIGDFDISNAIMSYDQEMRAYQLELVNEEGIRSGYREATAKIFDGREFNNMLKDYMSDKITRPVTNPQLFSDDPALINQYIVAAQYIKNECRIQLVRSVELLAKAKQLIKLIKNEYHLRNE